MPRPMPTRNAPSTGFILPAAVAAYGAGDELGFARLNAGLMRSEPVMPHALPGPPRADVGNARDDAFSTLETTPVSGSVFADNGSGADTTPGAVTAVNGSAADVNHQITLASGALLTLNADGTFTYTPNTGLYSAPAPGSGAANIPQQDHFSYTLTNGDTANVTISITGVDSNDLLVGSVSGATLTGGIGDDFYAIVAANITIVEQAGQGFDAIYTNRDFTLNAGAEVEWLQVSGAITRVFLTGNAFGQYLVGHSGQDILDGGGGADLMIGLAGDDTYIVDNANDAIVEAPGDTGDFVYTSVSYTLAAGVEVENLWSDLPSKTTPLNMTGNEFNQLILGNNGNNIINGGGGADAMNGFNGNDTFYVDNVGDSVSGNGAVFTTVSYALTANNITWFSVIDNVATDALDLTGNATAQYLIGNAGDNALDGAGGGDILIGLGGADNFAFTTAVGATNVDVIADFVSGTDKIALDDAVFAAIGSPGALAAGAFVTGATAGDADDRIIYDSTGRLFYDADGNGAGAAVHFATLQGVPVIAASDFTVI